MSNLEKRNWKARVAEEFERFLAIAAYLWVLIGKAELKSLFFCGPRTVKFQASVLPLCETIKTTYRALRADESLGYFDTFVGKSLIGSNEPRYCYGEVEHTTHSLQCRKPACRRGGGEHVTVAYRCERNQAEVK